MRPFQLLQGGEQRPLCLRDVTVVQDVGAAEFGVSQPSVHERENVDLPGRMGGHAGRGEKRVRALAPRKRRGNERSVVRDQHRQASNLTERLTEIPLPERQPVDLLPSPRTEGGGGDLERIAVYQHHHRLHWQGASPKGERKAVKRVLPDPRRAREDAAKGITGLGAQGIEASVVLPARPESDWEALVGGDGRQDAAVELDERFALQNTRGVGLPRPHEIVLGRRAKAQQADETRRGRRAAPVHPKHEDAGPHRSKV